MSLDFNLPSNQHTYMFLMADQILMRGRPNSERCSSDLGKLPALPLSDMIPQITEQAPIVSTTQRDTWRAAQHLRDENRPLADRSHKEHLDKGIPKPQDGPNVKQDQAESCLTCIHIGKICHGSEVKGGRCRQCRGDSGDTKTKRTCLWLDPDNDIFTYSDAAEAFNTRKNPHNTKEGREARRKLKEAAVKHPKPPQLIADLEGWPAALPLLQMAAQNINTEFGVGGEGDILTALFDALALRNFMAGDINEYASRQPQVTAQQVILQTLSRMKTSGLGLSASDIRDLVARGEPESSNEYHRNERA